MFLTGTQETGTGATGVNPIRSTRHGGGGQKPLITSEGAEGNLLSSLSSALVTVTWTRHIAPLALRSLISEGTNMLPIALRSHMAKDSVGHKVL